MINKHIQNLNQLIHAPTRLAILSILISSETASFTYLKETIKTTDGNLSTHLSKLEDAGYVAIKKTFKNKRPLTICSLTKNGKQAFHEYIGHLEKIIQRK